MKWVDMKGEVSAWEYIRESNALVLIKDRTYFHSPPYAPVRDTPSDVLVVYYSRSGNTEAMAREIARKLKADIVRIESMKYSLDFRGNIRYK